MGYQRTVAKEVQFTGVGLHTGDPVHLSVCPAPADSGMRFTADLPGFAEPVTIVPRPENLVGTSYATSLGNGQMTLHTVEHLLAALAGLGIDNAEIRLDGPEVPIMDGSAAPFVADLLAAGVQEQDRPRFVIRVTAPIRVQDGPDKWIEIRPMEGPGTLVDYWIEFAHRAVGAQSYRCEVTPERFVSELSAARTFGFLDEVEALKCAGLARGGSLDNAIVIGDEGIMNPGGLRFADEFVRHKVLDLIGDLSLLGRPVWGHVVAHRSGHDLHTRLVAAILEQSGDWELVEEGDVAVPVPAAEALYQVAS